MARRLPRQADRAAAVFVILFGVYSLTFGGGFHSTDEMSMVAVTESLVKFGQPPTNQFLWFAANPSTSDAYGSDGQLYSKKGPLQSVLALPLYWLALASGLGVGLAAATRYAEAAAAPVLLAYLVWRDGRAEVRHKAAEVAAFVVGLGVVAAMLGTGYQSYESFTAEHFVPAVLGFIISPGRSVFVYSPLLLLAAAALPVF